MASLGLAHLSDIHLAGYEDGALFDEDADIRRELEYDLDRVAILAEGIHGLLIGGDVAGRGLESEFDKATRWISKLCTLLGVPAERVYCVPGNHDVDWSVIRNDPVLAALQEQLLQCPVDELNNRLETLLTSGPHRDMLLAALKAYNEFAAQYECDLQPEQHRWEQAIPLGSITVRLVGLTSALLSGPGDSRVAHQSRLALGPQVSALGRFADTFTVLLCHHPLPWLRDGTHVDHLVGRAHLQLFGHEHMYSIDRAGSGVRVHAGAVHPDRSDRSTWHPSYNLIRLTEDSSVAGRVRVDIWPRALQPNGTFGPFDPANEQQSFEIELIDPRAAGAADAAADVGAPLPAPPPALTSDAERRAARRFSLLSTERRLAIGHALGLLAGDDASLDEDVRARLVFHRAKELQELNALEQEMDVGD